MPAMATAEAVDNSALITNGEARLVHKQTIFPIFQFSKKDTILIIVF